MVIIAYACAPGETEKGDLASELSSHWLAKVNARTEHPRKIIFKDDIITFAGINCLAETRVSLKCIQGKRDFASSLKSRTHRSWIKNTKMARHF